MAFSLTAALAITNTLPGLGSLAKVEAASSYTNDNLLKNPTFDENVDFEAANGTSHAGNWFSWAGSVKTDEQAHSGTMAAKLPDTDSSLEQDIPGLVQGETYEFKVWAKLSSQSEGAKHYIGVKNYGGQEIKQLITTDQWTEYTIPFTYTGTQNVRVYGWIEAAAGAALYLDDASVVAKSDIQTATISNGQLNIVFSESFVGELSKDSFSATYKSSTDEENVQELVFTEGTVEGRTLTLAFDEVAAKPVAQTVTVNLTYTAAGQVTGKTITLDYTVDANGEEEVVAALESIEATNGQITAVLSANPTVTPAAEDFRWKYQVGENAAKTLEVKEFQYDAVNKTVTVKFDPLRGNPEGVQNVTVLVTYKEVEKSNTFELPQSESQTIYVSASGSDENDGYSEETPIQSIDKLNTMTFLPGDRILFKKGDTFVGCFKPKGSGTEEAPITIGSYGEGDEKPVLQPGADFTVPYLMSANALETNPTVNYVIWFYNVEYYEISNLELEDPKHETTYLNPGNVYRSGITIQAEDAGILEHIYVDSMEIHGFHGPHTNIGKSSGGITMNVITDLDLSGGGRAKGENCVPTQINDIRVTNCEIYNVGRSGINFLTPWSYRNDEKWGPFDYGTRGFDYLPYEDFYMGNNYIHDVDGDGTIIDNCAGAVSEYNLVTRCVLNTNNAAVGLFNWNSDRTTFQYNEVFDIRYGTNESSHLNDSQGIEIDALNDITFVQYNYVHDNTGGFMMLCNVGDNYRSFDGIIRYNISQNDYAHPRQGLFDIYSANWGTEVYNNNFYLTERALSPNGYGNHVNAGELFLFSAVGAGDIMKFYNNIFYYAGETQATVNTFGDSVIDWQSNIFYNFANMPVNDNLGAPNLSVDPMWVNAGAGGTGSYVAGREELGYQTDLSCYYLQENSPAINAGVVVADNGGKDYFGNPVEGIPDIGAYESGSIGLKVGSSKYVVNQNTRTITVTGNKVSVDEFKEHLVTDQGISVSVQRNYADLTSGTRIATGDLVNASYNGETISYKVVVAEDGTKVTKVPLDVMRVTAGTQETSSENTPATNAIDGNTNTIWHSAWDGAAAAERWITIELTEDYVISGYEYTPRIAGGENGIITGYQIYTSNTNNGSDWVLVAEGNNWAKDTKVKSVMFAQPVQAKYIKLLATSSHNDYVSAAEIGLFGQKYLDDQDRPEAPEVTASEIGRSTVKLSWTEAADEGTGISEYLLKQDGKLIASFAPEARSYIVGGLKSETKYTFTLIAVDEVGNESEAANVEVTTKGIEWGDITDDDQKGMTDVPNGIWVAGICNVNYNGTKQTFDLRVYDGNKMLTSGKDYIVSYKNNQNAFTYTDVELNDWIAKTENKSISQEEKKAFAKVPQVILKMKGDYTGTKTLYFHIEPKSISDNDIDIDDIYVNYNKGKVQKPAVSVLYNGKKLGNKDFKVTTYEEEGYNFGGNASTNETKELTIKGIGNFTGETTVNLTVGHPQESVNMSKVKVKLASSKISWSDFKEKDFRFAENDIQVFNGTKEVDKENYTVSYEHNKAVGKATVIVTGVEEKGCYGTRRTTFQITGDAMKKAVVTGKADAGYLFTGEAIKLLEQENVEVTYGEGERELTEGEDFEVSYSKNINKGTAAMTLTGKADAGFTGTLKVTYKIVAKTITKDMIDCEEEVAFMKGGTKPVITIKDGAETLTEGKDYTVSYKNNKKLTAKPTLTIKGKGNYSGQETLDYSIVAKSLKDEDVRIEVKDKVESNSKGGWKQSFKVYGKDGKALGNSDYDVTYEVKDTAGGSYEAIDVTQNKGGVIKAGHTIRITLKGKNNYTDELSAEYRIIAKTEDISKAKFEIEVQYYTGKPIVLTGDEFITKTLGGTELTYQADGTGDGFTIVADSYVKNINKGTAKVTLKGTGKYGGTKTITFKIKERDAVTNWWKNFEASLQGLFQF